MTGQIGQIRIVGGAVADAGNIAALLIDGQQRLYAFGIGGYFILNLCVESGRLRAVDAVFAKQNVDYRVLPVPDGELTDSLENRNLLLKTIREIEPDVIITHRTRDYHPDHRCCGQLVMDCSYRMGVPLCCPEAPAMRKTPVILSMWDRFTNPVPRG